MRRIFHIRHDERWIALIAFFVIGFFQYLIISKFFCLFANYSEANWTIFINNFHMSGYDPITYSVVTDWNIGYNILRHPLLPYMMLPFYLLNQLLWWITGANCVQLIVGFILFFCSFYSFIFLYRILHNIIGSKHVDSIILTLLFFGFGHVLVAIIVPDHFCLSLFLILLTVYLSGEKVKEQQTFTNKEIIILFTVTAGITLSNGVITGLAVLWVNGKQVFNKKLITSIVLMSVIMISSALIVNTFAESPSDQQVNNWVDTTMPRKETLIENFFGESIQLHRKHVLGDVLTRRPVFVRYSWTSQYAIEALIVLLMVIGIYVGRRREVLQIACACFVYAFLLHIVLGFAINEVYIMSAHWIFIFPIAIAALHSAAGHKTRMLLRIITASLVVYLWLYHGVLLYNYLTWPLRLH